MDFLLPPPPPEYAPGYINYTADLLMKPLERKVMYFVSLINTLDTNKTIENNYTQTRTGADTGECKWGTFSHVFEDSCRKLHLLDYYQPFRAFHLIERKTSQNTNK